MTGIPKRTLGRTGLEVTTLGYGAMELRGAPRGPEVSETEAATILNAVLDLGINYIDTSPDYGKSEELIGKTIAGRRSEYFLASKCGCIVGDAVPPTAANQPNPHVFTAAMVRAGVEQSLSRMRTTYLDLVQFHASPSREQLEAEGALEELQALQREGKVRFLGMSGVLPNLREQVAMGVFDAFQIPYSAIQREHEAVISDASTAGAGVIIRGGAARGAPSDWQNRASRLVPADAEDRWNGAKIDDLLDGMTPMEFTLRFTLSNPDLDTTIVGTRNIEHLRGNVAVAATGPLPDDVMAEAKRRLTAAGSAPE
ncbi:aldo/keto reductase [bacterium SCGC AG-212-C10]|nr:aldo/keto reductase [bacterium SCGC AG-212-C10]